MRKKPSSVKKNSAVAIYSVHDKLEDISKTVHDINNHLIKYTVSFENHIEQDKLMQQELHRLNQILAKNTDSLQEHMRRTEAVEGILQVLQQEQDNIKSEIEPLVRFKTGFKVIGAVAAFLGLLVGAIKGIFELLRYKH